MIKTPKALKFIHLTDPHIAGDGALHEAQSIGCESRQSSTRRLRAVIDRINMDHDNADFVVITGDLTDHGDERAYEAFARELRRLAVPSHLLIGNHDDARAFAYQFPETQRCEHGFIQGSKRTPFGLCLFLDTSQRGTSEGLYCAKRRAWLADALQEIDGPVMLFMHHAPFAIEGMDQSAQKLTDRDAFWAVLQPHKDRIRHIFIGDAHQVMFGNWRGISVSGMRGLHRPSGITADHAQHLSTSLGGPCEMPSYGIVMVDADHVLVHMHDGNEQPNKRALPDAPVTPVKSLTPMVEPSYRREM